MKHKSNTQEGQEGWSGVLNGFCKKSKKRGFSHSGKDGQEFESYLWNH